LTEGAFSSSLRAPIRGRAGSGIEKRARTMANTPKWNIRLRHEWLSSPLKKKRLKRCQKARIGLLDAEARHAKKKADKAPKAETAS